MLTRHRFFLLLACGASSGCAARFSPDPAADRDPIAAQVAHAVDLRFVVARDRGGTAVPIGPNTVITCWHNFVDDDGVESTSIEFDGVTIPVTVLDRGDCPPIDLPKPVGMMHDWAVLSTPETIALRPVRADAARELRIGDTVYLAGYFGGNSGPITHARAESLSVTVVRARVAPTPSSWTDKPEELICLDAPNPDTYHGISGGAALVWDEYRNEFILIGIYRGMWKRTFLGLGDSVHIVRRIPPRWSTP